MCRCYFYIQQLSTNILSKCGDDNNLCDFNKNKEESKKYFVRTFG